MRPNQIFEIIPVNTLPDRVRQMLSQCYRLVQISATRLPGQLELTYSFDRNGRLANLRLHLSATEPRIPSISSLYWCAFLYENEIHDLFNVRVDGLAVDFHGNLYQTAVKFPFMNAKPPAVKRPPAGALPAPMRNPKSNGSAGTATATGTLPTGVDNRIT